jgi:hypothetical protein
MSNKKQTAVEYLHKEYMKVFVELEINTVQFYDLGNALGKAKQIEKEQIMDANIHGYEEAQNYGETSAEQYYKNTYEK